MWDNFRNAQKDLIALTGLKEWFIENISTSINDLLCVMNGYGSSNHP
jgi:hypothetical protein